MELEEILRIIAADSRQLNLSFDKLDELKVKYRQDIAEVIERYLHSQIANEQGYIKTGALTDQVLGEFEDDLLNFFSEQELEDYYRANVQVMAGRLRQVDQLTQNLGLGQFLGDDVFEMQTVQQELEFLSESFVRYSEGTPEFKGAKERITDAFNNYRLNRQQDEFTLRTALMDELQKSSNILPNNVNNIATTSLASIDRQLRRVQSSEAGIEHAIYAGIFDDLIRPFCNDQLGIVRPWADWDAMENNMPEGLFDKPVSKYGGGINCRHYLVFWNLDWSNGETDLRSKYTDALRDAA